MKSISHGTVELAHQVGEEQHRALEDPDHDEVAALVVAADLRAELARPCAQVLAVDEGLADRGVVHGRGAHSAARRRVRTALAAARGRGGSPRETATPATQATSPPTVTTGSVARTSAARRCR